MKKKCWKERKWTNKGTDKPYVADSLIHSTTCHTRFLYQFFKILVQVVPEKSLMKIFIFITLDREIEKRKDRKKTFINRSTLVLFSLIHLVVPILYTKFKDTGSNRS